MRPATLKKRSRNMSRSGVRTTDDAVYYEEANASDIPPLPEDSAGTWEDLKIWLEYTRFYDIDYRNKILKSLRQLKALDEQRSVILSELNGASGGLIGASETQGIANSAASASASQSLSTTLSVTSEASPTPYAFLKTGHTGTNAGPKTEPETQLGTTARDAFPYSGIELLDGSQATAQPCQRAFQNGRNEEEVTVVNPIEPTRGGEGEAEAEAATPIVPRSELSKSKKWPPPQLQEPNNFLNARYFLIKSFNASNIEMSQKDGLWITKPENGKLLTDAFNKSKQVFLFYSINKSKTFQGYARMVTSPSPEMAKAEWMKCIHWETSAPFRVEWLNTRYTEFWEVGKLRNPFLDNKKVFVGFDGQEYNAGCGRKLMEIMDNPPAKRSEQTAPPAWKPARARGGGDTKWGNAQPAEDGSVESVDCANWQPVRLAGFGDTGELHNEEETRSVNLIDW